MVIRSKELHLIFFLLITLYFSASELRNWLLYYGLPCLDGILPEMYFRNFSYFVNAVYLLLKDQINRREIILADYCLKNFYLHAELYYGISNWSSYKLCGFSLVLTSYFANVEIAFFVYRSFTSKRHAPTMTGKNVTYIANGNFNTFCQQMQIWFRLPDSSIFHVTSSL